MDEGEHAQRLVRRNFWFSTVPRLILAMLIILLAWEVLRQNVDQQLLNQLPWRIHIFDTSVAASLLGAFTALSLTREQFARSVRPALGWSGRPTTGASQVIAETPVWAVYVDNGNSTRCSVIKAEYRFALFSDVDDGSIPDRQDQWMPWRDMIRDLEHLGLTLDRNYYLLTLGPGATVARSGSGERELFALFDSKSLSTLLKLDVRLHVVDIAGDVYERILRLLHIAPSPHPRLDSSEGSLVKARHGRRIPRLSTTT